MVGTRRACRTETAIRASASKSLSPAAGFESLAALLRRLPAPSRSGGAARPVVLAVSGGADSLALLMIAGDNRAAFALLGVVFHVVTVDHGLRDGSAAEASEVGRIASAMGLPHEIRRWEGAKPVSNVQSEARAVRYRHLIDVARRLGASAVVTAHHRDDQIETHLLAKERGAGDRGLSGMRDMRELAPGVHLLRPFLAVAGARLKESVSARGLPVVDDPSNRDARYDRIRLRQAMASGAIDCAAVLAAVDRHAARRDADDHRLAAYISKLTQRRSLTVDGFGVVRLSTSALPLPGDELLVAFLSRVLPAVGGAAYAPGHRALDRLAAGLSTQGGTECFAATLGGVAIRGGRTIAFMREFGRTGPPPRAVDDIGAPAEFDRRFAVAFDPRLPETQEASEGATLAPFGALGRGNSAERTLPVLVDGENRPIALPSSLRHKARGVSYELVVRELVSWRMRVDLPPVGQGVGAISGQEEAG